jgi:hypothetical protein
MNSSALPKTAVDLLRHEAIAPCKPAFSLHEIEEEHACELKKGEPMAIFGVHRVWQPRSETLQGCAELPEEAGTNRLGAQRIGSSSRESE